MKCSTNTLSGGCLCGSIRYDILGPVADIHACHCTQCRKQSGHFVVATSAKRSDLKLHENKTLKWYKSSQFTQRGFCSECGSALFWDDGSDLVSINVGTLDQPTGLKLTKHIFVEDKADYYEIDDKLEKHSGYES